MPDLASDTLPVPGDPATAAAVAVLERGRWRRLFTRRVGGLPVPFWWLWLGTLVNRAGTFVEPFLVLYLTGPRHLSVGTAGAVVTAWGLGGIGSAPLGGWMTDRFGRRSTLGFSMFGTAAMLGLLAVARGVWLIAGVSFAVGLVGDVYRPAASATVADLLDGEQRTRAFALQFWAINLGFSVATLSAGFLARAGFGLLFAIDAITCAVFGAVVLAKVPESRPTSVGPQRGPPALRVIVGDRLLLLALVLTLAYAVLYAQVYLTLPLAVRAAGLSTAAFGGIIAVNGIVIVLVQPIVLPWLARMPRRVLLPGSVLLYGGGLALTGLCSTTWQFALTVVIWTLGEIGQSTALTALVSDLAPAHLRGRYMGAFGLSWGLSGVLGPVVGSSVYGLRPALLWWCCLGIAAATAVGHLVLAARIPSRSASPGG